MPIFESDLMLLSLDKLGHAADRKWVVKRNNKRTFLQCRGTQTKGSFLGAVMRKVSSELGHEDRDDGFQWWYCLLLETNFPFGWGRRLSSTRLNRIIQCLTRVLAQGTMDVLVRRASEEGTPMLQTRGLRLCVDSLRSHLRALRQRPGNDIGPLWDDSYRVLHGYQ